MDFVRRALSPAGRRWRGGRTAIVLAVVGGAFAASGACGYDFRGWDFSGSSASSSSSEASSGTSGSGGATTTASSASSGGSGGTAVASSVASSTVASSVAASSGMGGMGGMLCTPVVSPGVGKGVDSCGGVQCSAGNLCCIGGASASCNVGCCNGAPQGELRCQRDEDCKNGYLCCEDESGQITTTDCIATNDCEAMGTGHHFTCTGTGICPPAQACLPILNSEFFVCF